MKFFVAFLLFSDYISQAVSLNMELDKEHLKLYPYCGKLFGYERHDARSRVVNSRESKTQYPWVVYVERISMVVYKGLPESFQDSSCSGTIIGNKQVVTAAHCTCSSKLDDPDKDPQPHEKSICKPEYSNQITPKYNEMKIYGGHMDIDELQSDENQKNHFIISYAYAKDIDLKNLKDPFLKSDVAILISNKPLFDHDRLKATKPLDRPSMVPICLAAVDTNLNQKEINGVGWGLIYDESPKRPQNPYYSSCMTNEIGPEDWRFEHCNWEQLKENQMSCRKDKYPDDVENNDLICKRAFNELKKQKVVTEIGNMDWIDKIHIHTNDLDKPRWICYNEKHLVEKGWCEVLGHDPIKRNGKGWGFCSPSCKDDLLKQAEYPYPNVYHEMKWTVWTGDKGVPNPCALNPGWNEAYKVCMKITLPGAMVARFQFAEKNWNFITFKKEDNSKKISNYKSPCEGDSGSGQWITLNDETSSKSQIQEGRITRSALVAVHAEALIDTFKVDGGLQNAVCGSSLNLPDQFIFQAVESQIITNREMWKFITKWEWGTPIPGPPISNTGANFEPMKDGEKRTFTIDKTKKDCKLKENEITVHKDENCYLAGSELCVMFEVVKYEKDANIQCDAGYIHYVSAEGQTNGCGIAKILTKLCLNEEQIHNVANNEENESVKDIQEWIDECKASKQCDKEKHLDNLINLQKWVNSECSKLVSLYMSATQKSGAYVYFNAALESGYTEMFIKTGINDMYPKDKCRAVETLKGRYNNGKMVEGNIEIDVYQKDWFFCKPIKPMSSSECKDSR